MRKGGILLIVFFGFLLVVTQAVSAWVTGCDYRIEITLDKPQYDLTGFQVLINGTGGIDTRSGGIYAYNEIAFANSSDSILDFDIENPNNQDSLIWVEVDKVSSSLNTTIYLYYGCSGLTQMDYRKAWDKYFLVGHLQNSTYPNSVSGSSADTIANVELKSGVFGYGMNATSGDGRFLVWDGDGFGSGSTIGTMMVWLRLDADGNAWPYVAGNALDSGVDNGEVEIIIYPSDFGGVQRQPWGFIQDSNGAEDYHGGVVQNIGGWYLNTIKWNATGWFYYMNKTRMSSDTYTGTMGHSSAGFGYGFGNSNAASSDYIRGDELRVSNQTLTDEEVNLFYDYGIGIKHMVLGEEESLPKPNLTSIWINSTSPATNYSTDDVIASFVCTGMSDPMFYNISWLKNDVVQFAFTGESVANNTQQDDTLNAGNISSYDYWNSEIECCDVEGCTIINSSKVYIQGVPNIISTWINSTAPALNTTNYDLVGSFVCNYTTDEGINISSISNFYAFESTARPTGHGLALDLNGLPYVSYYRDGIGGYVSTINTTTNTWNTTFISSGAIGDAFHQVTVNVTGVPMFATRANGGAGTVFVAGVGASPQDTTSCVSGGFGNNIDTDTYGVPHIVTWCYEPGVSGTIRYCNQSGGGWSCMSVVTVVNGLARMKLDNNNNVHLVYRNNSGKWMYCTKGESDSSFSCETTGIISLFTNHYFGLVLDNGGSVTSHFTMEVDDGILTYCNRTGVGNYDCINLTGTNSGNASYNDLALDNKRNIYVVWSNITSGSSGGTLHLADTTQGFWDYTVLDNGNNTYVAIESKLGPGYLNNFNDVIYVTSRRYDGAYNITIRNITLTGNTNSIDNIYNVSWLLNNITQFTFNGSTIANSQVDLTLKAGNLSSGDLWNIETRCCNGILCSGYINSSQLEIEGGPPIITTWINSTCPIINASTCDLKGSFVCVSEGNNTLNYNVTWLKNNVTSIIFNGLVNNNTQKDLTLKSANLTVGDLWNIEVECIDVFGTTLKNSSQIKVNEFNTTINFIYINSTNPTYNYSLYDVTTWFNCTTNQTDTLYYNLTWLKNNLTNLTFSDLTYPLDYVENVTLHHNNLSIGERWRAQAVCWGDIAIPFSLNSSEILIESPIPVTTALIINSTNINRNATIDNVTGQFRCNDVIYNSLTYNLTWLKNNLTQFTYVGIVTDNVSFNNIELHHNNISVEDLWNFEVQCCNALNCSAWVNSSQYEVMGYNVTIAFTDINSTNPAYNYSINDVVGWFNCSIVHTDIIYYNLTWLKNNLTNLTFSDLTYPIGSVESITLSHSNLTAGQRWNYEATCWGDEFAGAFALNSSEIFIEYSLPTVTNVFINSTAPSQNTSLDNITGWFNCNDNIYNSLTYNLSWIKNGVVTVSDVSIATTNNTLNEVSLYNENVTAGEYWNFTVQCCNTVNCSAWTNSSLYFVRETGLNITNITIYPNPASPIPSLNVSAKFTKMGTGTGTVFFRWYKDGVAQDTYYSNITNVLNNTIVYAPVNVTELKVMGNVWTVQVNASGSHFSEYMNASIVIGDTKPTPPIIALPLNGTVVINASVEIVCNGSVDAEGDMLNYSIYMDQANPPITLRQNTSSTFYSFEPISHQYNQKYYIRCRTVDGKNESDWSGVVNFTVDSMPIYWATRSSVDWTNPSVSNEFRIDVGWNNNRLTGTSAKLIYDGVSYNPAVAIVNGTVNRYTVDVVAPDKSSVNWLWNITLSYKAGAGVSNYTYNTSYSGTQYMTNFSIFVYGCTHGLTDTVVIANLTLADEPTRIVKYEPNGSMGINLDYWIGSSTVKKNIIALNYTNEMKICLTPANISKVVVYGDLAYADETPLQEKYDFRFYYFCNELLYNSTIKEINVYQLQKNTTTEVIAGQVAITVSDAYGGKKVGEIVKVNRQDVGIPNEIMVAMGKTNSEGEAMVWLDTRGQVLYGFDYYDSGTCSLDSNTSASILWSQTMTTNLPESSPLWSEWDTLGDGTVSLVNDSTGCIFGYTNSTELEGLYFSVDQYIGGNVNSLTRHYVNGTNSVSYKYTFPDVGNSTTSYVCTITGVYNGGMYRELQNLQVRYVNATETIEQIRVAMGKEGLFAAFLLIGVLSFAMLSSSPTAVVVVTLFAFMMTYVLGLITLVNPVVIFGGLVVLVSILIWRMQKHE